MRSSVVILLLSLTVLMRCPSALGQPTASSNPSPTFVGNSPCPTPSEVLRETVRLSPQTLPNAETANVRVTLEDLGDRYHLQIAAPLRQIEKTYLDPSRDCSRRARFAAVLIVLTLMPPEVETDSDSKSAETKTRGADSTSVETPRKIRPFLPPEVRSEPPKNAEPNRHWFHLDVSVAARGSPPLFESPALLSTGALLYGSIGPGRYRSYLEMGYFPKETVELLGITTQLRRTPVALGFSLNHVYRLVSIAFDVGAILEITRVQGIGLASPKTQSTFDGGAQLGGHLTLSQGLLVPTWGIKLDLFPSPSRLEAAPRGHLGKLPTLDLVTYLGGSIGF